MKCKRDRLTKYLVVILPLLLISCVSYFKRKNCESTNWFDYGQKVALDGRRLTGDQFISECYQAEADLSESDLDRGFKSGMEKYCQPETVFYTGKNGNYFSREMCEGGNMNQLLIKHRQGVLLHCLRSNGYAAGATGRPYNKICPADLEPTFMPEFNRGRKRYLGVVLNENEKQLGVLDAEVAKLQVDLKYKNSELTRYSGANKDEAAMNKYNSVSSQIYEIRTLLSRKQNEQAKLREKNREIKIEIVQLGN